MSTAKRRFGRWTWVVGVGVLGAASGAAAGHFLDFGKETEDRMNDQADRLFGVERGLARSSGDSIDAATANADPTKIAKVAKGLNISVVSADPALGANIDQMILWPNDRHPTHIIACNEEGDASPGVQRIKLRDGSVETMVTGTISCDPIRRTAWGTVLFGEENGNTGQMVEIIDPMGVSNVLFDRVAGTFTNGIGGYGADHLTTRWGLGRLAFEGLAIYPNGVSYYGDENRPGKGTAGGAFFKFIPTNPFGGGDPIQNLADSPLASGTIYGLRVGKRSGNTDYGQGSQTGEGTWVTIPDPFNADLRAQSATLKLTGYYRPEDIDIDPNALDGGRVRFCGNNTGNEIDDRMFGETVCITDGSLVDATANVAVPEVQYLVVGFPDFAMMDNIAFQSSTGNWVICEDGDGPQVGRNNDVWSCLDDGADPDLLTDGCIRIATLNDLNAEWTGGFFDHKGRFIVSVQHNVTGHGIVLAIGGWR